MATTKTMTPKELASDLGTDAKTLRKFLREQAPTLGLEPPGQGGRYSLTGKQAQSIRKAFNHRTVRAVKAKDEVNETDSEEIEEIEGEELEDLEDLDVEA